MKTEDILKMTSDDVSRLTLNDLRKVTQQLIHVEQVRMNRLQKAGVVTPALESYNKIKDTLSTKGKTLNEVRATFYQAKYQLGLKTSTVSGAKNVMQNLNKRLGGQSSEIDIKTFWQVYNKYQEMYGLNFKFTGDSEKIQRLLYSVVSNNPYMSIDYLLNEFDKKLTEKYEDDEDDFDDFDDLDDIF